MVTLGAITYHEDQIRIVMQLRNLQRELVDYAPPALSARLLQPSNLGNSVPKLSADTEIPWWKYSPDEEAVEKEVRAIVTHKSHAEEIASLTTPKGLLLTGPPGSGKSFLIDMWYSTLPTPFKARKHYNQLVLEIYRSVWEETQRRMRDHHHRDSSESIQSTTFHESQGRAPWNRRVKEQWRALLSSNKLPSRWSRFSAFNPSGYADPTIAFVVAKRLVLRHWILIFDEIQLLDVSSAGLLSDVLSWYWRMGGIIVGTSNKVPDDLYKNGVQRERLEPFVEALKARCPVVELDVKRDWREEMGKMATQGRSTWYTADQREEFEGILLASIDESSAPHQRDLNVFGRTLHVPWAHGSTCRFTFSELCEESLGAADYLTIASHFSRVIITDIPILPISLKDQARRFISLIDALYESRCRIVCLAESVPEGVFFPPDANMTGTAKADLDLMLAESITESQEYYRPNVSFYDAPEMQVEVAQKVTLSSQMSPASTEPTVASLDELSIFSGKDEQFAFKRALSRILEMTSPFYDANMAESWNPLSAEERKWELQPRTTSPLEPDLGNGSRLSKAQQRSVKSEEFGHGNLKYNLQEAMVNRPHAPHIHPAHIWGVWDDGTAEK